LRSYRLVMQLLSRWLPVPKRCRWASRAFWTCSRMAALAAPSALAANSWKGTAGTSMGRSMRSSRGPLILPI